MNTLISSLPFCDWQPTLSSLQQEQCITALEDGQVLFFPQLQFEILADETDLISPTISDGKNKNISFNLHTQTLGGVNGILSQKVKLKRLLMRYANQSLQLVNHLFPYYQPHLEIGRTSFRPIEVAGRQASSYRKDDTRLHVDAFPASPNQGKRILRVFSNINLQQQPRHWRIGEPFQNVAQRFLPQIKLPFPTSAFFYRLFRITRSLRTPYDHYMLHIHDKMKADRIYQQTVASETMFFPAQSSWLVFTDQVSHAALGGQHVLEQTFYLPVNAMAQRQKSPLYLLEKMVGKKLIF